MLLLHLGVILWILIGLPDNQLPRQVLWRNLIVRLGHVNDAASAHSSLRQVVAQCRNLVVVLAIVDFYLGAAQVPIKQLILIAHPIILPIIKATVTTITITHISLKGVVGGRTAAEIALESLRLVIEVSDVAFLAQAQSLPYATVGTAINAQTVGLIVIVVVPSISYTLLNKIAEFLKEV